MGASAAALLCTYMTGMPDPHPNLTPPPPPLPNLDCKGKGHCGETCMVEILKGECRDGFLSLVVPAMFQSHFHAERR